MDPLSFSYAGYALSVPEQVALRTALQATQINEKLNALPALWGKIHGNDRDYLIAQAVSSSFGTIKKQFYVYNPTVAGLDKLATPSAKANEVAPLLREPFSGDPSFLYKKPAEIEKSSKAVAEAAPAEENADAEAAPAEEQGLSELDRLSWVVHSIDAECSLVPQGALQLTASKEIIPNKSFSGLSLASASNLSSYFHYRDSTSESIRQRIINELYHFKGEFLDSISGDLPKGAWGVHVDDSNTVVNLRSVVWPGYFFFHKTESSQFFGAYFGSGQRANDAAFLL